MAVNKKTKPAPKTAAAKPRKRQSTRYPSDVGALAFITGDSAGKRLSTPLPALVVEESFKGCSLLALSNETIEVGTRLQVVVGKLNAMMAEIRWVKKYNGKFSHFGLIYLE